MRSSVPRRPWITTLLLCGCAQPSSVERGGVDPSASAVQCEAPSTSAIVVLQDAPCAWVAERVDAGTLAWKHTDPRVGTEFRGALPEPCVRLACEADARTSPWGPLVVLYVPSAESEMPGGAWLGVPWKGEVAFVDLWAGEEEIVWSDHTPLGPAHALAPFDCQGELALFAVERFATGQASEPSDGLKAREGRFSGPVSVADETEPPAGQGNASRSGCERLAWSLR